MPRKLTQKTKRQRFITVGEARVNKILDSLDGLYNLANKNNYEYNLEEVKRMFEAIRAKIEDMEEFFNKTESGEKSIFKFAQSFLI